MSSEEQTPPMRIADSDDIEFTKRGCCCFWQWKRMEKNKTGDDVEEEEKWWWSVVMMREWSEIAAGPKWKTFIRRFGRNRYRMSSTDFRYDPMSYALNFDETAMQSSSCSEAELLGRDFSARYASIPASSKSSVDIG